MVTVDELIDDLAGMSLKSTQAKPMAVQTLHTSTRCLSKQIV